MDITTDCGDNFGLQDSNLRKLLSKLIAQSPKKRPQIAEEMSKHTGQRISADMLNDWTSECHRAARFPAVFIEAFCEVVGSDVLQRHVMGARLRGVVELREEQLTWFAESLRAELQKPQRRPKSAKANRARKS